MASVMCVLFVFFFSSRRRHTRLQGDWSSDVCSSDLGEEGNDQPLMVVNETWRSAEYDLLLYAMQDDPRHGRTTMELEELNLAEPDRGLFLPPADYTIQDRSAIIQ